MSDASPADDGLSRLVEDQEPCSIDDISPDVLCDRQTEKLFMHNEPEKIINGEAHIPETKSGSATPTSSTNDSHDKLPNGHQTLHDKSPAKKQSDELNSLATAQLLMIKKEERSDDSSSDSDSSTSSSSSNSTVCRCDDCQKPQGESQHVHIKKEPSPTPQTSSMDYRRTTESQSKTSNCCVRLYRLSLDGKDCIKVRQLSKLLSPQDLFLYRRKRRGWVPQKTTDNEKLVQQLSAASVKKGRQTKAKEIPTKQNVQSDHSAKQGKTDAKPTKKSNSSEAKDSLGKSRECLDSDSSDSDEENLGSVLKRLSTQLLPADPGCVKRPRSISSVSSSDDDKLGSIPIRPLKQATPLKVETKTDSKPKASGKPKQNDKVINDDKAKKDSKPKNESKPGAEVKPSIQTRDDVKPKVDETNSVDGSNKKSMDKMGREQEKELRRRKKAEEKARLKAEKKEKKRQEKKERLKAPKKKEQLGSKDASKIVTKSDNAKPRSLTRVETDPGIKPMESFKPLDLNQETPADESSTASICEKYAPTTLNVASTDPEVRSLSTDSVSDRVSVGLRLDEPMDTRINTPDVTELVTQVMDDARESTVNYNRSLSQEEFDQLIKSLPSTDQLVVHTCRGPPTNFSPSQPEDVSANGTKSVSDDTKVDNALGHTPSVAKAVPLKAEPAPKSISPLSDMEIITQILTELVTKSVSGLNDTPNLAMDNSLTGPNLMEQVDKHTNILPDRTADIHTDKPSSPSFLESKTSETSEMNPIGATVKAETTMENSPMPTKVDTLTYSSQIAALLQQCRECRVEILDCMKFHAARQREREREKEQRVKAKEEARIRDKKRKLSTDDEESKLPTKEKSVKVEDSSSTKQDSTSSVTVTQKTKPVEKSLDPWSQAIATFGMPKIPKKKKQVVPVPAPQTATERMQKVQEALRSSIRTTPTMAPAPSSLGDGSAHRPNPNRIQEQRSYWHQPDRGPNRPEQNYPKRNPYANDFGKPRHDRSVKSNPYNNPDKIFKRDRVVRPSIRPDRRLKQDSPNSQPRDIRRDTIETAKVKPAQPLPELRVEEEQCDDWVDMGADSPDSPIGLVTERGPRTPNSSSFDVTRLHSDGSHEARFPSVVPQEFRSQDIKQRRMSSAPKVEDRFKSKPAIDEGPSHGRNQKQAEMNGGEDKNKAVEDIRDEILRMHRMATSSEPREPPPQHARSGPHPGSSSSSTSGSREGRLRDRSKHKTSRSERPRSVDSPSSSMERERELNAAKAASKGFKFSAEEHEAIKSLCLSTSAGESRESIQARKAAIDAEAKRIEQEREWLRQEQERLDRELTEVSQLNRSFDTKNREESGPILPPPIHATKPDVAAKPKPAPAALAKDDSKPVEQQKLPVTNALMKQEFLDEIARISLVISKRIAVATGVPEEALSANKDEETNSAQPINSKKPKVKPKAESKVLAEPGSSNSKSPAPIAPPVPPSKPQPVLGPVALGRVLSIVPYDDEEDGSPEPVVSPTELPPIVPPSGKRPSGPPPSKPVPPPPVAPVPPPEPGPPPPPEPVAPPTPPPPSQSPPESAEKRLAPPPPMPKFTPLAPPPLPPRMMSAGLPSRSVDLPPPYSSSSGARLSSPGGLKRYPAPRPIEDPYMDYDNGYRREFDYNHEPRHQYRSELRNRNDLEPRDRYNPEPGMATKPDYRQTESEYDFDSKTESVEDRIMREMGLPTSFHETKLKQQVEREKKALLSQHKVWDRDGYRGKRSDSRGEEALGPHAWDPDLLGNRDYRAAQRGHQYDRDKCTDSQLRGAAHRQQAFSVQKSQQIQPKNWCNQNEAGPNSPYSPSMEQVLEDCSRELSESGYNNQMDRREQKRASGSTTTDVSNDQESKIKQMERQMKLRVLQSRYKELVRIAAENKSSETVANALTNLFLFANTNRNLMEEIQTNGAQDMQSVYNTGLNNLLKRNDTTRLTAAARLSEQYPRLVSINPRMVNLLGLLTNQ